MLDFDILSMIVFSIPLFILVIRKIKKKNTLLNITIFSMTYIYIVAVIAITIYPIPIQSLLIHDLKIDPAIQASHNNFIIFNTITEIISTHSLRSIAFQLVGNILLFMPLGFYLPLLLQKLNIKGIILIGVAASLSIEIIQGLMNIILKMNYKVVDVDDLLLNLFGTIIGFIIYKMTKPLFKKLEFIINEPTHKKKTA